MKRIFKYATGDEVPEGAIYLTTIKNGLMPLQTVELGEEREFVWHYFLVEVKE